MTNPGHTGKDDDGRRRPDTHGAGHGSGRLPGDPGPPREEDDDMARRYDDLARQGEADVEEALRILLGLLAAGGLVALGLWWTQRPPEPPPPVRLGSDGLELNVPTASGYGEVSWTHPSPAGLRFEVKVYDRDAPPGSPPVVTSLRIPELHWTDPEGTDRWPARVSVVVTVLDEAGDVLDERGMDLSRDG